MADLFSSCEMLTQTALPILGDLTSPILKDPKKMRGDFIDNLVYTALFSSNEQLVTIASDLIYRISELAHCSSTSIYPLYRAFGEGKVHGFTVPAINVRTLTYDTARLVFRLMQEKKIGAVVFEIARSEIEYTHQSPQEYAVAVLAAAIKEEYVGPVFIQGDHYQFSKKKFAEDKEMEINKIKALIKKSLAARFYNIDIDASTLVDLEQVSLLDQQKNNSEMTALLTKYIHELQPKGVTVSIGGEIGHIGGKNSTVEDFEAFMQLYQQEIPQDGITKVSVQTGTSHGGIPLPDGSIQKVDLDFGVLKKISQTARSRYHLGGAVQHGASTLPLSAFDHFVENDTLEIHLATGLQNIVYDTMPDDLRSEMYAWIKDNLTNEKEEGWTEDQFIYKTRKKALGPFKQMLWDLTDEEKKPIVAKLTEQLTTIFDKLHTFNTREVVNQYVK
ncbi:MAG TPA: class II fructose-bisphosphate aldolase [Patescibacteria group bacterium]|nr:class II fructose-bisphosphate aldolase [Patescibacteria group bacterium]